ncbi:MAG: Ig-like domain-containing protein [Luteolibacter sp.]|uniref:Ig-like domain-containing protein n=1 Tax=Luteolibacter sp. TaxID=1962973 RepID=UPI003266E1F1
MKPRKIFFSAATLLLFPALSNAQSIEFGNINVVQNDANNTATSVTLTKGAGSTQNFTILGGNRGDYDVSFGTPNDVAGGVVMSCVTQTTRDNVASGDTIPTGGTSTLFTASSMVDFVGSGYPNKYWIPVARTAQGDEVNINTACAWFSYNTWLGGFARNSAGTNGGANNALTASSGINLGTQFVDAGSGVSTVNLTSLTSFGQSATAANGILLVTGAKNEDNYAAAKANADGTFTVWVHDNGVNGGAYEQDPVAFVYLPTAAVGTNQLVATGRVRSGGTTSAGGGSYTLTKGGVGQWYLSIPGHNNTTGVLMISPEGGGANTLDNVVSYQWDNANSRWVIESRDLSGATALPTLQDGGSTAEEMFSFAFLALNNIAPTASITAPASGAITSPGMVTIEADAADTDGTITQVDFLRNGVVVGTDTTPPYSFTDTGLANGAYNYVARAVDNNGSTGSSATTTITVAFDSNNIPANTALQFDGVNDYVTMGPAPELNVGGSPGNGLTLECWFRKTGTGVASSSGSGGISGVPLFGKGRGESDGSNVDCDIFFGINASGLLVADFETYPAAGLTSGQNYPITATNTPIANGVWNHAAVTYDNATTTWKMYLNGVQVGTATAAAGAAPRFDSIQHFGIGSAFNSSGVADGAFAGVIDEARVWNHARTGTEIAASMATELSSGSGLLGRFGFNEGVGLMASSSSGVSVGTLTNGPAWVEGAPFTAVNAAPSVAMEEPQNNASSFMPYPVTFVADASDSDGTVVKVEFSVNGVKVGEGSSDPFNFVWNPPAVGNYAVTARAIDDLGASKVSAAVNLTIATNPNQSPVVTLETPSDNASVTGSSVPLNASVVDPDGDPMTVTFYGRETVPVAPGVDFSVVAIPDTQYYSEGSPAKANTVTVQQLVGTFGAQTQWIVDNRDTRNVAFVSHMGDLVENGNFNGNPIQWQRASAAMGNLEDPVATLRANGIPYGLAPGNHDIDPIGSYDTGSTSFYNQYFNLSRFQGRSYWGGNYGTDNTNNYELFSASGLDFIAIHLSYDTTPNQPILDWADALLKTYPNRRAIVTSHSIIGQGNPATFSPQGSAIYENLKDNPNLFLMLCGHIHAEGFRSDTFEGRKVYTILSDYQGLSNGGQGLLRILTFSPANNRIHVESWSPTQNRAANLSDNLPHFDGPYDLSYNMQNSAAAWVPLGTVQVPAGGTTASIDWNGLQANDNYEWYAAATDGVNIASTSSRRFGTTGGVPPSVTLDTPVTGANFLSPATVSFTATATDDGSVSRVEFYNGGTKLGEDTTAPYEFTWTGVQPGNYTVSALAFDDLGLGAVSNSASITVDPGDLPPTVALTSPTGGALFNAPATVTLTADANDAAGSVAKVEFYSGSPTPVLIGEDTTAPFSLTLNNVGAGTYTYSARATDSIGQTATSASVNISVVTDAPVPVVGDLSVGNFDLPTWTVAHTGPAPHQFNLPGTDAGDLELKINGTSVPFTSGIALATNWNSPGTIASGTTSFDNICQPYANATTGKLFVSVLDNSNNNAVGANPTTSEQSAGVSVAFLPYASGWTGASVNSTGGIISGNLPSGVTISKTGGGTYTVNGLSVAGNLLAFTNGDTGTLADNVCSVRIVGGQWVIDTRDNAGGAQDNEFTFVYLPAAATGVYAAKISSAGVVSNTNQSSGAIGITTVAGTDGVDITFGDGSVINPNTATLFITADATNGGATSAAVDNLIAWNASGNGFRVFTQDLEGVNGANEAIDLRILAIPFIPISIPAGPLPEVVIAASDSDAGEYGADQSIGFTISRTGSTTAPLVVPLTAAGSASEGADYSGFVSSVTIPATQTSVTVSLTVFADTLAEGSETVTMTLAASPDFIAGSPATASATIADNPSQQFYFMNITDVAKRAPGEDADGDANANIIEYFMGTLPGDANSHGVLEIPSASGNTFKVRYPRAKNRPDVSGSLRWSADMIHWFSNGQSDGAHTVNFAEAVVSAPEADPETVEATATISGDGAAPQIFVRLGVE